MVTLKSLINRKDKIAVVGLGYVGLPLAVRLSKHFEVIGYDFKSERIRELKSNRDRTLEVTDKELAQASIFFTDNPKYLSTCRFIIVAVPTPIDAHHTPDLAPLRNAFRTAGKYLAKGTCMVLESTVFPGATEEICVPILENESGLQFSTDFTVGYSPERINPGDTKHRIENIPKVVSGSDSETTALLAAVYGKIVMAGIHRASSIKVAEAAKVIENTQRDLNIALMNELAMIFHKLGIDTHEVLTAAATKWNFLPFEPGLVGGHCIGVDPYYLTFKAESMGYHPEMILAGRRINDSMGKFIVAHTVKMLIIAGKRIGSASIAVLGLTFKENVPDLRNTKVTDIIDELTGYGVRVLTHDPLADAAEARSYYGITLREIDEIHDMDAVILAVNHDYYRKMGLEKVAALCGKGTPLIIDIKGSLNGIIARDMGITYWRL